MATLAVSANKVGGRIRNNEIDCYCGGKAYLSYINEIGRHHENPVTVKKVPVYRCTNCSEEILLGSDATQLASKIKEAAEKNKKVIDFE